VSKSISDLLEQASLLESRGSYAESLQCANDALQQARAESAPDDIVAAATVQVALSSMQLLEVDKAEQYAQQVLQLSPGSWMAARALLTIAFVHLHRNNISETEKYLIEAGRLSRRLQDVSGFTRVVQNLCSTVYLVRGQFHMALIALEEISALQPEGERFSWGYPATSALMYLTMGDRIHGRLSLKQLQEKMEPGTRSAATYNLLSAMLELDEEQFGQAEKHLQQAFRISTRIGLNEIQIWVRTEFSRYHRLMNEPGAALPWALDAIRIATDTRYHLFHIQALTEKAQVLLQLDETASALEALAEAEERGITASAQFELTRVHLIQAIALKVIKSELFRTAWLQAYRDIKKGEYYFLIEKKRKAVLPILKELINSTDVELHTSAEDLITRHALISPVPLHIHGLGQFRVYIGARLLAEEALERRRSGDLLRFLLLQPEYRATRDQVIDQLWTDINGSNGVQLLHQATSNLRRVFEPDLPDRFPSHYLKFEGNQICLVLPSGSSVDFIQFAERIKNAIKSKDPSQLEAALKLYKGALFSGESYDDWSIIDREMLLSLYLQGSEILGQRYLEERKPRQALEIATQMVRYDSFSESAVWLAMKSYQMLGDAPRAIRVYIELEKRLLENLDVAPRQDLQELAAEIRIKH